MKSYALHNVQNPNYPGFSLVDYSKFKYGHDAAARKFGEALAKGFFRWYLNTYNERKQLVVICSPYSYIPPASEGLMKYFIMELNRILVDHNMKTVQTTKAYRSVSYIQDYGALTKDQRLNLISQEVIHLDTEFCKGKHLIFLDDVKITGSHEHVMREMLSKYNVQDTCTFIYFAQLVNQNVPAKYEDYINHFHVKNIGALLYLMLRHDHTLNMRTIKFMLKSDPIDFNNFLSMLPEKTREQIWDYAVGENYHKTPEYSENMGTLSKFVNKLKLEVV